MAVTLKRLLRANAAWCAERIPSSVKSLAEPPPDSGLQRVLGNQGVPVIGHALSVFHDPVAFSRKRHAQFGPVNWGGLLGVRGVWIMGPDAVGEVLNNTDRAFANGPAWSYFIGPFFHRGLMLLDSEEHLQHKQIMQEAFSHDRLQGYLATINDGVARGMAEWVPDSKFRLYEAIKLMLLNVATEVFVGREVDDDSNRINRAFVETVAAGRGLLRFDAPGGAWHRGVRSRKVLERYFREQIAAKRKSDGTDLFSVLCNAETDDGTRFSDDDIVNHMIFVLMAAHDTSTITSSMMAYYLAKYPAWQDKVRAECLELPRAMIAYEDMARLPLLDQVFREALRLNPPVPLLFRETVKDTAILGRYVPAGTKLFVLPISTHRLGDFWPDPDSFDPDRFAPHRRDDRVHRFLWSPFGGGVHKCIGLYFGGMEVKAILYQLLRNFSWSVDPDYEPPMGFGTGLYPEDGLPVHLLRQHEHWPG